MINLLSKFLLDLSQKFVILFPMKPRKTENQTKDANSQVTKWGSMPGFFYSSLPHGIPQKIGDDLGDRTAGSGDNITP